MMKATSELSPYWKSAARLALLWLLNTQISPTAYVARCDSTECACGPDFCQNDTRYDKAMKAKKISMKKEGYPDKLLALLDKDGKCYAQVSSSPEKFTIRMIYNAQQKNFPWTQQDEDLARKELLNGEIKAFYMFNVDKAFKS